MTLEYSKTVARYGEGEFAEYRIPALTVLENGTVIAAYESRRERTLGDWAETWITVQRSTDGGKTFESPVYPHQKINDIQAGSTVTWNNPVLIADGETVHLIFHGDYASAWYCRSKDNGQTFCTPKNITDCFRGFPAQWNVCASGPGHGLVDSKGRLVVPVWLAFGSVKTELDPGGRIKRHEPSRSGCIFSDDGGETWYPGFVTSGIENANEAAVVPLSDGRYLFNFRNCRYEKCRVLGIADPELKRLEKVWSEPELPDPGCMGGMAAKDGSIYFVNCANVISKKDQGARINLSVSESTDEGNSWKRIQTVEEFAGYADIAAVEDGLYVFYEKGIDGKFPIEELILKKYLYEN